MWIEIFARFYLDDLFRLVTPLAGVWIEIGYDTEEAKVETVTPLVGVWIEILSLQ